MKMRVTKKLKMIGTVRLARAYTSSLKFSEDVSNLLAELEQKAAKRALVEFEPEPVIFTVARKKDGEIVGTFESRELAEAEIERAKKNKKAALVLV